MPRAAMRVAVALLALTAGCAHGVALQPPEAEGWTAIRSEHITLYTDAPYPRLSALDTVRQFEMAWASVGGSLFRGIEAPDLEVLYLERGIRETIGQNRRAVTIEQLPGKGQLGNNGLIVVGGAIATGTASHTVAHLMLAKMAPGLPLWLHEAYAQFLETSAYYHSKLGGPGGAKGKELACIGLSRSPTCGVPGCGASIPLADLFAWTWATYDRSKKTAWYTRTATALLDYLMLGDEGAHRPRLVQLIGTLREGATTEQAVAAVFAGVSVKELDERVTAHRRAAQREQRGLCPVGFVVPPARAGDLERDRKQSDVAPDVMGNLLMRVRMIPRRLGYVDWYPKSVMTLEGARTWR